MTLPRYPMVPFALVLGGLALLLSTGCADILVPKHKVLVDAISAPGTPKLSGQSYRLVARKSVVTNQQVQLPVIAACLNAALVSVGMFEAPPNVPSDIFIEVSYGVQTAGRVDPSNRETFLQLSARSNRARVLESNREEELWDVRVAVMGVTGRIETAMPLLCQVASTYATTDTHIETKVEVPQNSPAVAGVRETAIKLLQAKTEPAPAGTAGAK